MRRPPLPLSRARSGVHCRARPRAVRTLFGVLVGLYGAGVVTAAAPLSTSQRAQCERLALARARSVLLAQVQAAPLPDGRTIGTWVTEHPPLDRALRAALRERPRTGALRVYSDGTVEADASLMPAELRTLLTDLQQRYPPAAERMLAPRVLAVAAERWTPLWSTGVAVPAEGGDGDRPPGWDDITPEGVEVTRRAAAADARSALLDEARGLRVTAARRLADFLDSTPAVQQAVAAALERHVVIRVTTEPDQVAVATAELPLTTLIGLLTDVHRELDTTGDFHAADFREMALHATQSHLRAAGLATPPERYRLKAPPRDLELDRPEWAGQSFAAVGRYAPEPGETPPDEAVRVAAARTDALDQLRRHAEGLVVQDGTTVSALLGTQRALKDDVILWLSGARLTAVSAARDTAAVEVRVVLPAERLWQIMQRGMQRVEITPDDAPAPGGSP
jgi:hypothetical protein